jgi:transcriptional regulator with XRE-family HTH domain
MSETDFGDRLRRLRMRDALTQVELAEKAGINPATVAYLEQSVRLPRMPTIRKLARALGVRPAVLTTGES